MHTVEIYLVGGTVTKWTEVPEETTKNLVEWLDDKENTKTFKATFPKHNKTTCLRKELILFVDII